MNGTLTIRDATLDDAAVIAEIYNESILAGDSTMVIEPRTAADIRHHIEEFTGREGYLLLEREGYVVGWGVIKGYGEGRVYRYCCETSVFLRRAEVGKGYGSRLKRAVIDRCRAYGYHHLVARIWASNTASIAYNRNFGYEVVGIQKKIGYINGQWRDVALMQLVLDDVPPRVPVSLPEGEL
ncbi:MAG: GNAT family N-acetyltransferase [Rhodothermales bacterium]